MLVHGMLCDMVYISLLIYIQQNAETFYIWTRIEKIVYMIWIGSLQTNAWLDAMVDSLNEITECIQDVVLISMVPKKYFQSIIL